MLNPSFNAKCNENEYFLPTDPESFRYVLEFLTYDELQSQIEDIGILKKLIIDSDYLLLPELKKQAQKQLSTLIKFNVDMRNENELKEDNKIGVILGKFASTSFSASYWNWNIIEIEPPTSHFSVSGNTITFTQAGYYQISVKVCAAQAELNGHCTSIYINGADVSQSYSSISNGCYISYNINEAFNIKANDKLQVYSNIVSSYNAQQCNKLTILLL